MDITKYIKNKQLEIKVIPNAKTTHLKKEGEGLKLYLKAVPEKNKANQELILFFKKRYSLTVSIKHGATSRKKILEIS